MEKDTDEALQLTDAGVDLAEDTLESVSGGHGSQLDPDGKPASR